MANSGREQRRYPRIYFGGEAAISAEIQVNHGQNSLAGAVLNISAGGLQFSFKRQGSLPVDKGDKLTLQALVGLAELTGLAGSALEVRWVLDHEFLEHVAVGCEFVGLATEQQQSLQRLVDNHLAKA